MFILISMLFYIVPVLIVLWFMISVVSALRENNEILRELINKIEEKK
ncbi:hypothetical protein MTP04_18980 [Lysinibacillus sp. PLM2]|nr:hypothetical protein MTP04_18980 [Lysinibacillus sp. PLM2]